MGHAFWPDALCTGNRRRLSPAQLRWQRSSESGSASAGTRLIARSLSIVCRVAQVETRTERRVVRLTGRPRCACAVGDPLPGAGNGRAIGSRCATAATNAGRVARRRPSGLPYPLHPRSSTANSPARDPPALPSLIRARCYTGSSRGPSRSSSSRGRREAG